MHSFPAPALALVEQMVETASKAPSHAISFQGAPGANSHRAALEYAPECHPVPCFSFEDALEAVKEGRVDRAIIPIENSQNGRVADIHFLLPESGLSIVGEHFLSISHALMGIGKGPFKGAYSHPQALGQSRHYLRKNGIVPISYADTAGAAAFVKEQGSPDYCAIAPILAASLYDLDIVAERVEDASDNTTRFVILAREAMDPVHLEGRPTMTTLLFTVQNVPAALYKAIGAFATNGINVTKLESYQKGASFAATTFYTDVEGAPGTAAVDQAIANLAEYCSEIRMLGSYEQSRPRV